MKNLFIALMFFLISSSAEAVFEYDQYLEKILDKVNLQAKFFKNQDYDPIAGSWLEKVDTTLNPNDLGTYDANFFVSLNSDGSFSGIEIEELRETNSEKFKNFIASLTSYKFPALPDGLENYVFNLDARTLFIDRKIKNTLLITQEGSSEHADSKAIDLLFTSLDSFNLIKPNHIDRPAIGEEIIFSDENGVIFKAKVIDLDKNNFKILAYQAKKDDRTYHLNRVFKVESSEKGSHNTFKTVLDSGFGAATLSGLGSSISTHGIMPGALMLMGTTGAVLEENEKNKSFDFVRGDKISLTEFQD